MVRISGKQNNQKSYVLKLLLLFGYSIIWVDFRVVNKRISPYWKITTYTFKLCEQPSSFLSFIERSKLKEQHSPFLKKDVCSYLNTFETAPLFFEHKNQSSTNIKNIFYKSWANYRVLASVKFKENEDRSKKKKCLAVKNIPTFFHIHSCRLYRKHSSVKIGLKL